VKPAPASVPPIRCVTIMNPRLTAYRRSMFSRGWIPALLLVVLGAGGCSLLHSVDGLEVADYRPRRHAIEAVPFYPQRNFDCGPAALAMVLNWSGISVSADALAPQVLSPKRRGTLQAALVAGARRYGRSAYEMEGFRPLLEELTAGNPVIVLQNLGFAWPAKWHYAVAVGYDLDEGIVVLHSGKTAQRSMPIRLFLETWRKSGSWGLLVLPPSEIPSTASEQDVVAAMIGLESAGQWKAAIEGYAAAIARWKRSIPAHVGLANSHYAAGDLDAAERVLRRAVTLAPQDGVVCNNLAQVLGEQGKREQALQYARRAVAIGGPHEQTFRATLNAIQAGDPLVR